MLRVHLYLVSNLKKNYMDRVDDYDMDKQTDKLLTDRSTDQLTGRLTDY